MTVVDSTARSQISQPATEAERRSIEEQLHRVLASPIFKHSKRYPAFLKFVVEQSLLGNSEQLKERVIGVEVFNCDVDYDTSDSAIVRVTALEVRRRLTQYYHEPGHENEIRIVLTTGSYIPIFQFPAIPSHASPPMGGDSDDLPGKQAPDSIRVETVAPNAPPSADAVLFAQTATAGRTATSIQLKWLLVAACLLTAVGVAGALLLRDQPSQSKAVATESFDRFWTHISQASGPVQFYFGTYNEHVRTGPGLPVGAPMIHGVREMMSVLEARQKTYAPNVRILTPEITELNGFFGGPVIYIGGQKPAQQLLASARYIFHFDEPDRSAWVHDTHSPLEKKWRTDRKISVSQRSESYGMVAKFVEPQINRPIVVAVGLSHEATVAATRMLTTPEYMTAIAREGPENWEELNWQAVIEIRIANGDALPPRIVATHFWK